MIKNFATYTQETGGRAILLFLLFGLAIYQFISAGFSAFTMVCVSPVLILALYVAFKYPMAVFWFLCLYNYVVFGLTRNNLMPSGVPLSLVTEGLEILLLGVAIIDARQSPHFERAGNLMLYALAIWCGFCTLEILNDTCGLGMNAAAWYQGARMLAFQILYVFLIFTIYINNTKRLVQYLLFFAGLSLFGSLYAFKQKYIGFSPAESAWLVGSVTHVLQGGTLIRYFSIYSDAANFGEGIASAAVAFFIFGITTKIKKYRYLFLITGVLCVWGMFLSGTRTAMGCLGVGIIAYIFLSKSVRIAVPVTLFFGLVFVFLAFTNIGQGNQQIRRMRSVFNKKDQSANARTINQETMRKYLKEAPWGIGIGMNPENVPKNNKYTLMSSIPADSHYVFVWIHTGKIGLITFIATMLLMLGGACWIVLFRLRSPSLRGVGAGFCCGFIGIQLGAYGNEVLFQFPNCLIFYGGLTIVYILPFIEKEWIEYETKELAIQEEKERLKLEKKKASRV
ncbi:MAG: O-antigen ligase family protein [Prevotella sp.]|nr:O-antigen ligase family protein [Prevotella sp.]